MNIREFLLNEGINDKGIFKAVFMAGHPGCFDGDTLVKTENGYKKIFNIDIGERVYTFNENTGEIELKKVLDVLEYIEHPEDILEIIFDNGEKVICTENHEFYINGIWVKAKHL